MKNIETLPKQFSALQPFAEQWGALETASERYLLRQSMTIDQLSAFHDAAGCRLDEIFDYLDRFPDGDLPAAEACLYRTVMGLSEVMQAVEVFGSSRVKNAPYPHHIETVWMDTGRSYRESSSPSVAADGVNRSKRG